MDKIHHIIKELRLQNDMTLKDVAKRLNTTEATIQRYESGKGIKAIPYDKIIAYSELFGVDPTYLITGEKKIDEYEINLPNFDPIQIEVIQTYSQLNVEQQKRILELMKSML